MSVLKLINSSSRLARVIERDMFEMAERGGYFDPNVQTSRTEKDETHAWSGNGMGREQMFVRGSVGILDSNGYFRLELTTDNTVKETKISKGTYEAMKKLI